MSHSDRWARWLLLATAAVPVVYVPLVLLPGLVPRAVAFRALVAGALVATAFALSGDRRGSGWSPRRDVAAGLLTAFVAVSVAASLAGIAPLKGLFGTLDRMWGVVAWIHLLAFYCLLRLWFRTEDWTRYLAVAVATSTLFSVALLVGELGWISLPTTSPWYPTFSFVFGNPGPAAAYLMVGLFLAGLLYVRTRGRLLRSAVLVSGALQGVGIVLLGIRASLLGTALGAAAVLLGLAARKWGRGVALRLALGAGAVVVAGVFLRDAVVGGSLVGAFLEARLTESSMGTRWLGWVTAVEGIGARPLLGFGPESFSVVFERFFDPAWYGLILGDDGPFSPARILDRPHNAFLRAGVETGVVGGALYLAVFGIYFWRALRAAAAEKSRIADQGILLLGLGTAMAVYLFFWFEDHAGFPLFVATLALSGALAREDGKREGRTGGLLRRVALPALLATFAVGSLYHHGRLVQAARAAHLGEEIPRATERVRNHGRAFDVAPPGAHRELAVRYATNVIRSAESFQNPVEHPEARRILARAVELGLSSMEEAIRHDPEDPDLRFRLAGLHYAVAYPYFDDPRHLEHALERSREAISLAPDRIHYRHELAVILLREGRVGEARRVLAGALERYEGLPRTHDLYSRALRRSGRFTEAAREQARADSLREQQREQGTRPPGYPGGER